MTPAPKAFVIGWPIAHSRSPLIHNHWLTSLGIAGSYDKIEVAPDDLSRFIRALRERGFVGGNVTIPHKETVARLCDRLTPTARRLGAVNTLWLEDDKLFGDSTDGEGFLGALDQEAKGWDAGKRHAAVLGAGGAARAVVAALQDRGFARITVVNRTSSRSEALAAELGCEAMQMDGSQTIFPSTDLLVNTTSLGMKGQDDVKIDIGLLPYDCVVDDIVYVPKVTGLLRQAESRGLRTVGGLGMLLHQAVPGFERWFGARPRVTPELQVLVEADIGGAA